MNQQELIQRLAELSGMTRAIMMISTDTPVEIIASQIECTLDDMVESLQSESQPQFQSLHPCNHQWTDSIPSYCPKCGERKV